MIYTKGKEGYFDYKYKKKITDLENKSLPFVFVFLTMKDTIKFILQCNI